MVSVADHETMHPAPSNIWNRRFLTGLAGFFFLFLTVSLFFLFPLYLEGMGASEGRIGLIMGMNSLAVILVRPLVGRTIDRSGRKRLSLIGIFIQLLVFPFYLLVRDAGWLPLVLRAVTGVGWGVGMTAIITMCSDLAPAHRLAHSMGIIGIAGLLSQALGPLIGEEIIRVWGFQGIFFACIGFAAVSFLCILMTRETIGTDRNTGGGSLDGLRGLPVVIVVLIGALPLLHGAVRSAVVYFVPLFFKSVHIERIGPFFVAFSAAAILTRLGIGGLSDRFGRKRVILPAVLIISLNLILLTFTRNPLMVVVTGFVGGFGQGLLFPALSTYIIDILGYKNKGLAISLYLTLFDLGIGVGSPLFGWISDVHGFRIMYWTAAAAFVLVMAVFILKTPDSEKPGGRSPVGR